jgi:HD-GYP domain-containing protein (c-di-GMP phosphodiesterase class II)
MPQERTRSRDFRRCLLHAPGRDVTALLALLPADGVEARPYEPARLRLADDQVAVLLLDPALREAAVSPPARGLGEGADRLGAVLEGDIPDDADPFWPPRIFASLPEGAAEEHLARAVRSLFRFLEERTVAARSTRELAQRNKDIEALNQVGIALAAETDPERLIPAILSRARALTQADAGTLYLLEDGDAPARLEFRAVQCDSARVSLPSGFVPLDSTSLAGHVARTGEVLRLDDAYGLPEGSAWTFNRSFDEAHGYRTRSVLVVPLRNTAGRILGALQLMNRKRRVVPDIGTTVVIHVETVPFDEDNERIALSLASQAAVALENARLTAHLRRLFEGFVEAAVTAIEQRDPTTSGHSHRVARLSCALAEAASRAPTGPYAAFRMGERERTVLRYAAVLHDFGKVGVREWILVKAKKLPPGRIEVLAERLEQARLSAAALVWETAARGGLPAERAAAAIGAECDALRRVWDSVVRADEPSVMVEDVASLIEEAAAVEYRGADGRRRLLLSETDRAYLSISKGSLDAEERREIESHVSQTFRFLSRIPWTPELRQVPELAYLHHEKLDGSGYPRGITAGDLPPQARIMTICDIYDALWAADRPYKKAVPCDRALAILEEEALRGAIDADLFRIFLEARIFETVAPGADPIPSA